MLVAQGFKQEEGIDYDEVFAPVAGIEAIRLFLAFASYMGFTVYQVDVKSAFLYGTIEEEVYVHQPPGFVDPAHPNKVYKERFQMSSMGELTFFLGLKVKQQPDRIFISQDKYVADILKKFDFWSIRTATTPIESNKLLVKDEDGEDVDVHVYRSMIGSLMYLTASRPDIMKQTIVANSTTEAEYVAATNCCGNFVLLVPELIVLGLLSTARRYLQMIMVFELSAKLCNAFCTDKPKVSTDKLKVSTDKPNEGTTEPNDGNSNESAAPTTVFRDDETIAQFLPLPKIDPKDKGKKVLEEKPKLDAESEGVNEAEKKFKMRKMVSERQPDENLDSQRPRATGQDEDEGFTFKLEASQKLTIEEEPSLGQKIKTKSRHVNYSLVNKIDLLAMQEADVIDGKFYY
ncbi:retrovirus-related pol polyprotein from transposon TNT 1-94 [Tanacetum coccineum]